MLRNKASSCSLEVDENTSLFASAFTSSNPLQSTATANAASTLDHRSVYYYDRIIDSADSESGAMSDPIHYGDVMLEEAPNHSRSTASALGASSPTTQVPVSSSDPSSPNSPIYDTKKHKGDEANLDELFDDSESDESSIQEGTQEIRAITTVWSKKHLIIAYVMIWVIFFVDSLQQGMSNNLLPFVTSDFAAHSMLATTGVLSSLIGGLWKLALAKVLDIWGRPQGYMVSMVLLTIGLATMAACRNIETYAAAQVFYWVGLNGISFSLQIFIADTSALKNRSLMFAFSTSPYLITTWVSGPLAKSVLAGFGWRWGYGIFTIITPLVTLPLFLLFTYNHRKAVRLGALPERTRHGRTRWQSVRHYSTEFDMVGLGLITAGLALFLLPFNIYTRQPEGWKTPFIIAMLVLGVLLMVAFGIWERFYAPVKYLPWRFFTNRTIAGAYMVCIVSWISFYIWDSFFSSFLQVVLDLDVTRASYVSNIYTMGSCLWGLVAGVAIRWTGRFKWLALYFALPLTALGIALMIKFRSPDAHLGYIIMCQIFIAVAGGTLTITEQMAAMASVSHQYVAVILAVESMFMSIGNSVGATVASAIWQGVFPKRLGQYLPDASAEELTAIIGSIEIQKSYAVGSATRNAINQAYGDAQRIMLIASTGVIAGAFVGVAVWKDIRVNTHKQVKGRVI